MSSLLFAAVLASAALPAPKYFPFDDAVVASSRNLAIQPGTVRKYAGNPLFGEEYPWEPRFDNLYPNIIWDAEERRYKCWYNLFVIFRPDPRTSTPERETWTYRESGIAYATSADGFRWEKPLLPEFLFEGRPSNVLLREVHGAGVFKDARDPDPARRYKMILRKEEHGEGLGLAYAFSADGVHWSQPNLIPNIHLKADTHNNALWAASLGRYVAFSRDWGPPVGSLDGRIASGIANGRDRVRLVARTESRDFVHWSDTRVVLRGLDDAHQVYAMPVWEDGSLYFGLPVILDVHADLAWTELAWSRDTVHWQRIAPGRPFLAEGPRGSFDWGCVYPSPPVYRPDGIRIYYGGGSGTHTGARKTHLGLALLGPDRLAAGAPSDPSRPAEMITRELGSGREAALSLTADILPGGSLSIAVWDPGAGAWAPAGRLVGPREATAEPVALSPAAGPRKFRFILTRARLYSFQL